VKDALNEGIGNQEPYSPQDLMKSIKKRSLITDKKDGGRGKNDMEHRKVSVSWQNDSVELSLKEQEV
jgi:hypothetical protein